MKNISGKEEREYNDLIQRLTNIELRLANLEKNAVISKSRPDDNEEYATLEMDFGKRDGGEIESRIGQYGMAWLGSIVLLIGIVFILQLLRNQDHGMFSFIFGFASVAGIYTLGTYLRKNHPYMSNLFTYNGHLLLFIVTLQLHFFTPVPLINNEIIGLILLMIVIGSLMYLAYRNRSQVLTGIVLIMIVIAALASNSTHIMLSLIVVIAFLSVFFLYKLGWKSLVILAIPLVYAVFLLWFFNNPLMTRTVEAVPRLQFSYIYLAICAMLFSMIAVLPLGEKMRESQINTSIILNGLGFSLLITLINVNFFQNNYYIILGVISGVSVAFSALLQSRGKLKLPAALYALYGFSILSVTIGGIFDFPFAFLLLSVESLLVVSMALWFRSRFIVSMNVVMFIGLLIAYVISRSPIYSVDISFALVALVTARVINWKKDRLEIKTEFIRNAYLAVGFIMTLVSLYHAVPQNYITFSWAMAAGLFFVLSLVLHNVKYRWLAIAAMLFAAGYFFIFDMKNVGIGYRVLALLVIAVISLSFSIFYSRRVKSTKDDIEEA